MKNYIARFGEKTTATYVQQVGLRYSDEYWYTLSQDNSLRTKGFLPNTPMSSIIFNTVLTQTSLVAYIIGEVLASDVIKGENGQSLITTNISVDENISTQDIETNIVNPVTTFLNRINNITGINNEDGSEITWRARQLGGQTIDDNGTIKHSDYYWGVSYSDGTLVPSKPTQGIITKFIQGPYSDSGKITLDTSDHIIQVEGVSKVTTKNLDIDGSVNIKTDDITIQNTKTDSTGALNIKNGDLTLIGPCDIIMPMRYNPTGTKDDVYNDVGIEAALYNIGQRLDNLGYIEGDITFAGMTYKKCLYRQGNYVFCNLDISYYFGDVLSKYFAKNKVLFTVPQKFAPLNNIVLYIGVIGTSNTGDIRTVTLDTSGNATVTAASGNSNITYTDTVSIKLNFGYETSPINLSDT